MALSHIITGHIQSAVQELFGINLEKVELQATRKDFEGDITMVIFPLLKLIKGNPVELGNKIGQYLVDNAGIVTRYNVVAGFLNIVIADSYYINFFNDIKGDEKFGYVTPAEDGKAVMVEYASPNTNKPLHLGHVRNVLLGYSVAQILQASGTKVYKTQVVNDRGIHICKSMLAWEKFGNGETPETSGLKGDKLVGKYYVKYDVEYKKELKSILSAASNEFQQLLQNFQETGKAPILDHEDHEGTNTNIVLIENAYSSALYDYLRNVLKFPANEIEGKASFISDFTLSNTDETDALILKAKNKFRETVKNFNFSEGDIEDTQDKESKEILLLCQKKIESKVPLFTQAQQMLLDWEAGKPEVIALWEKMNGWVYTGFDATFEAIGVDFDKNYYESNTYLLGKDIVDAGLEKGVFYKKEDGSVWIDLTPDGLDEKLVLRKDGTSVYITQDLGTAVQRVKEFPDVGGMVYTVGNEQDYHFKVLFLILKKLGYSWAEHLYHLSYGMVDLPSGKMKSREGTVVDADDLISEMTETAQNIAEELGKLDGYSDEDKARLYKIIGLGALKYYILKVDPKKRILFDPKESVDFAGNTGPFIQYTYARIQSLLRRAEFDFSVTLTPEQINLHEKEKELLKQVAHFPEVVQSAAAGHSPALIANYTYDLVKEYNSFYQSIPVLGAEVENEKIFRVQLSRKVGETIKAAFSLLGIDVPERM